MKSPCSGVKAGTSTSGWLLPDLFGVVLGLRCFAALWLESKVVLRKKDRHAPCASAVCLCIFF